MTNASASTMIRCLTVVNLAILCLVPLGHPQTAPLPTVTPGPLTQLSHCPAGFYTGTQGNPTVCYQHTYSCSSSNPITLTFSYISPSKPTGTIVLFNGGGGEMTEQDNNMFTAEDYFGANYAVVQTSWQYDWEDTNGGTVPISPAPAYNILTAACRPASFLNYINSNSNPQFHVPNTGMCAQGASAGGAGIAYSIVWYGLGSKLNDVEFGAGPTLSNIQIGCQYPRYGNVNICAGTQLGCSPGTLAEANSNGMPLWVDDAQYIANYLSSVRTWTGNLQPACNNGSQNTSTNNPIWKAQSIVTGTGGVFSWPSNLQGLAGWACFSYQGQCNSQNACPDNAAAEGQQFYLAINNQGAPPASYVLTGIQSCMGAEGVGAGTDPDHTSWSGTQAIENHMEANCNVLH